MQSSPADRIVNAHGLALLVSCCGGLEGPRTTIDLTGYAQTSCGPADGPAIEIYLTDATPPADGAIAWVDSIGRLRAVPADSADAARIDDAAVLRMFVWYGIHQLAGREFQVSRDQPEWGDVRFCGSGDCVPVTEGRIRFTSADADSVTGEYELRAPGEGVFAGSFRAGVLVRQPPICG